MDEVVQQRNGMLSILQKLPNGQSAGRFCIALSFAVNGVPGSYSLTIGYAPEGGFVVEREECQFGVNRFLSTPTSVESSMGPLPGFIGNRPALVTLGALPNFAPVFNVMASMVFYSPEPDKMRRPAPIGPGRILMPNSSNAADVLERIQRTSPEVMDRIRGYLRSFNPEFRDLTVTQAGGYRWLTFISAGNPTGWSLSGSDVSDGTLRAVAILLAIFQAWTPESPLSLVGLEEPEGNLHPAAAGVLLDALLEASSRVPIIASTHSADLLDRKDLPVNSLIAVALQDGETIIGPINEDGKAILRGRLYTAGELLRSNELNPVGVHG